MSIEAVRVIKLLWVILVLAMFMRKLSPVLKSLGLL